MLSSIKIDSLSVRRTGKEFPKKMFFLSDIIFLFRNLLCPVKDKYSVMTGWPISLSPYATTGVKRKQENVATKADKRKYEDKRDRCFQKHWLERRREGYEVHNLLQLLR